MRIVDLSGVLPIPRPGALLVIVALGCGTLGGCPADEQGRPAEEQEPSAEEQEPPADEQERPAEERSVCMRGEPFTANGSLPIRTGAGPAAEAPARRIADLRWEAHEGCERFVVGVAGDGDVPVSRIGRVRAELRRELGVVRVSLLDVQEVDSQATDARFDGSLARAAYAVRSPDGRWVYLDLHLSGEAEAHVSVLEDPARVVVDLRPGGGPIPGPLAVDRRVVVLAPRAGPASYPLTVTGYARTFEANVVGRIERDGEEVAEAFTTATAWVDAWGHYELTFEEGPSGPIELHVGEYSARDGTWEGVTVDLVLP